MNQPGIVLSLIVICFHDLYIYSINKNIIYDYLWISYLFQSRESAPEIWNFLCFTKLAVTFGSTATFYRFLKSAAISGCTASAAMGRHITCCLHAVERDNWLRFTKAFFLAATSSDGSKE